MQKSPFPGMDPFLELDWRDVHSALVTYARDQLQDRLPADLVARMESRVVLEDQASDELRSHYPDVRVVEHESGGTATAVLARPIAGDVEPDFLLTTKEEPFTERYLEIVDAATRSRVITTIEFVSPTNKLPGEGQNLYCQKREECLQAGVSFVEIDLTTAGERFAIMPFLKRAPVKSTYVACVRRGHRPDPIEIYYLPLTQPLKPIRIPLRTGDRDVILELQPLVEQAYDRGRYGGLDYSLPIHHNLSRQDAEWLIEHLRAASKIS